MSLRKVKSGDPLVIPSQTFNSFIDAARAHKARQQASRQTERQAFRQSGIVLVKNGSGADCSRFDVLGIDSPVITPTDNEDAFKNKVVLSGTTPSESDHPGRFVILLEPLADGNVGMACASGVCAVHVDVQHEDHQFADIKDGEAVIVYLLPTRREFETSLGSESNGVVNSERGVKQRIREFAA